jgi:signal transduction histidine kinase
VADVSHQLRTPLAALRLRLEMMEVDIPKRAHDDFDAATAEVHRLSRLVDGLLMLARAENRPSARERTDVAAIVAGRRATWLPLAEERHVDIVVEGRRTFALVTPGNLEQVLDNLIANAIDVSPAGTTITLRIDAPPVRHEGAWTTVHVVDEGPGMSPERRAFAFARFERRGRDTEGTIGGFGLGLAIVRQLVVADRGEVELLEAPSGGLDVCVRLAAATAPRRQPIVVRDPASTNGTAPRPTAEPPARARQLVSR